MKMILFQMEKSNNKLMNILIDQYKNFLVTIEKIKLVKKEIVK